MPLDSLKQATQIPQRGSIVRGSIHWVRDFALYVYNATES